MAKTKQIIFSYKEVAEALLEKQDIREGLWGVYVRFGIKAANVGETSEDLRPTAIVPILEIGLQRFDEESNLTVDAAQMNTTAIPSNHKPRKRSATRKALKKAAS